MKHVRVITALEVAVYICRLKENDGEEEKEHQVQLGLELSNPSSSAMVVSLREIGVYMCLIPNSFGVLLASSLFDQSHITSRGTIDRGLKHVFLHSYT